MIKSGVFDQNLLDKIEKENRMETYEWIILGLLVLTLIILIIVLILSFRKEEVNLDKQFIENTNLIINNLK